MANENVLEGVRCPKCGSEEPFIIQATAYFHVTDDGTDGYEEVEWNDEAPIKCEACDHTGTVRDFDTPTQGRVPTPTGYRVEHMGGGCTAWRKDADGGYILINNDAGIVGDPDTRVWAVGRCLADEEDEDLGWIAAFDLTLDEALKVADRLPLPSEGWSEQATNEQVAEWLGRAE